MKKNVLNTFAVAICGLFFCLLLTDITGHWSGIMDFNDNDVKVAYDFKQDGNKLTGTVTTPVGPAEIKDGKIDKDQLSFNIDLNGDLVPSTGKIYPDSINMKINYQGNEYLSTIKRSNK